MWISPIWFSLKTIVERRCLFGVDVVSPKMYHLHKKIMFPNYQLKHGNFILTSGLESKLLGITKVLENLMTVFFENRKFLQKVKGLWTQS